VAASPEGPYREVEVPTYLWLGAARLGEGGDGFAVGARGAVLRTSDHGATWRVWGGE